MTTKEEICKIVQAHVGCKCVCGNFCECVEKLFRGMHRED